MRQQGRLSAGGRHRVLACATIGCLALLLAIPASAQVSTASITGTVRDSTGAVVPEASVILQNVATGVERTTKTNSVGNYLFLSINPGHYVLQTSAEGFRTTSVEPFTLEVNQTATFDLTLEVGAVTESVTVEAIGAEVQASTAELGGIVGEEQVLDLPLNGRNFTQLLTLTPGASPVSVGQNRNGGQATSVGDFTYPSINGQSNRSNSFMTDGVNNTGVFMSTYAVPPIVDNIQEFKVQSHNDQAEFGGVTGGTVNVVTKSGTNEFHGSGWWFLRNDALDARNYFRQDVTPLRQNMFGGTVGGRIIPNKTFFFLAYQGYTNRRPSDRLYRVPTDANLRGDLSDWPRQIYNPYSTRPDPEQAGAFVRDPFPGNQIPGSLIDEGWLYYAQNTVPKPIQTGVANRNQLDLTPASQNQQEWSARIDHTLGPKDMIWGRASASRYWDSGSGGRQTLQNFNDTNSWNIGGSWVHTFSPTSILQVQFAKVIVELDQGATFTSSVPEDILQGTGFNTDFVTFSSQSAIAPNVNVSDYFSGGEITRFARPSEVTQFKGNFTKIFGNHQIKVGGSFDEIDYRRIINDHNVNFVSSDTGDPASLGTTGSPLASFLLNVPNAAGRRDFNKSSRFGGVFGFYVQDSWKVTQKLTVNFGLRYDYTMVPPIGLEEDRTIFMGNYDMMSGVYLLQAVPGPCSAGTGAPCIPTPDGSLPEHVMVDPRGRLVANFTDNWQPRFGLAYRLNSKTALRASIGIFFDSWAGIMQTSQNLGHTWPDVGRRLASNLNRITADNPTPAISGKDPFPNVATPAATPFNEGAHFQDPYAKNAYSTQWNLGFQHELRSDMLISMNYVGSGNVRLPTGGFYNVALTPGPGNQAERRPFPYIRPTNWHRAWGRGNYNAFQFQFRKRFSSGLAFTANYTWSKAIDMACSGFFNAEGCSVQDPYNVNNERSVTGTDIPQMFNVNWVYQLPFGRGRAYQTGSAVADAIIGDWQINGIATFRSGQAFTVNMNGDIANTGSPNGYMRPNLLGNPTLDNPTPERWFDTSMFAAPAQFTFGNAGRHIVRGDGRANFDLSVFRQFPLPLREGTMLEFRAEAFNAFNSTKFNQPTGNLSNSNFGRVTSASGERQLQLGLKLYF